MQAKSWILTATQKPPIDKTNLKAKHNRRSPSLEKPSDLENIKSKKEKKKSKKKQEKIINDDDSEGESGLFDVSPLPSPFQPKVTMTPKSVTPSPLDQNDKIKSMKFNEIFDMRELMRTIDDKIEKFTQQSQRSSPNPNRHHHSNENLSAKSDKRIHKSFLSNSQFESESDLFNIRNIESRNTNMSMTENPKKRSSKPSQIKLTRVTSSALNRIKEQQRIERENRVNI